MVAVQTRADIYTPSFDFVFTTQSKQSHHLESYLDSSSEYNALTTFKLPYGNTTVDFAFIFGDQLI